MRLYYGILRFGENEHILVQAPSVKTALAMANLVTDKLEMNRVPVLIDTIDQDLTAVQLAEKYHGKSVTKAKILVIIDGDAETFESASLKQVFKQVNK